MRQSCNLGRWLEMAHSHEALIERALGNSMKREKITSLPLYPEGRACKAPTANRIFGVCQDVRRHQFVRPDDPIELSYCDQLTDVQHTVLRLRRTSLEKKGAQMPDSGVEIAGKSHPRCAECRHSCHVTGENCSFPPTK
jgi:hypothetical protein